MRVALALNEKKDTFSEVKEHDMYISREEFQG